MKKILLVLFFHLLGTSAFPQVLTYDSSNSGSCFEKAPRLNPRFSQVFFGFQTLMNSLYCIGGSTANRRAIDIWYQLTSIDKYDTPDAFVNDTPGLVNYIRGKIQKEPLIKEKMYQFSQAMDFWRQADPRPEQTMLLGETAGSGRFRNLPPGEMWKYLIGLTGGDARQALLLLASTNDGSTGEYSVERGDPQYTAPFVMAKKQSMIPQFVSTELDLTSEMKNRIKVVYEMNGRSNPEPKSYHYNLAAFMSCEMLSTGASPFLIEKMQEATAVAYRMGRLNLDALTLKDKVQKRVPLTADESISYDAFRLLDTSGLINTSLGNAMFLLNPITQEQLAFRDSILKFGANLGFNDQRMIQINRRLILWTTDKWWTLMQHRAGFLFAKKHCSLTAGN